MPVEVEYPFLVSTVPFKKPKSESAWLMKVIGKKKSSHQHGSRPSINELWDELRHDHDVVSNVDEISHYRQRLSEALRKRK